MSYQEFEFWFMRFSRKEYDLNYDRSRDPVYREFSNLPDGVLSQIVDKVNPVDRFVLQKVSKPLRQFLSARNPGFQKIKISSDENRCTLIYDNTIINYYIPTYNMYSFFDTEEPEELRNLVRVNRSGSCEFMDKEARIEGDTSKIALHDLAMVVGNNKLRLEMFEFRSMTPEFMELIHQTFMTQSLKIQTDKLKFFIQDLKVMESLQFFDVKEEIILEFWTNWKTLPIDKIIGLPGIKDAKMLKVIMPYAIIPPDSILGLPRITIVIQQYQLRKMEVVEKLRNAILTSKSLEIFNIKWQYGRHEMDETNKLLFPNAVEDSRNPNVFYFTVPDTERTLEMRVVDHELYFRRR
ncbi:hypothetical protein CAEBREN_17038 [Caenorhabditis brenneri]|uniref:F-box domain-containing protein n=1 Tax=Caenorhabditis brenneri TaxID=135651 RepID=G0NN11_CAEBE|nr:hypothetical protein CAEBREN_17038 [Caenorhabditis brenneri]